VLLESSELLNGAEELNQLVHTSSEQVELTEDLVGGELELLSLGHLLEAQLGLLVLLLVSIVEVDAALEHWDELFWRVLLVVPKSLGVLLLLALLCDLSSSELSEVEDHVLAAGDHLVGDLDEQVGHTLVGVVVTGNGVDHLNRVHQCGEGLCDGVGVTVVQRVDELFKSLQVLHVVLGLVQGFGNSELNASPLGGGEIDLVSGLASDVSWALRSLGEDVIDGPAVLAS